MNYFPDIDNICDSELPWRGLFGLSEFWTAPKNSLYDLK